LTYFSRWPRWAAWALLLLIAALTAVEALPHASPRLVHLGPPGYDDRYFQRSVADKVARGDNYYTAAAAEQRANSYPTSPPQVFREPTLTWWLALLQIQPIRRGALIILLVLATIAMREALDSTTIPRPLRLPVTVMQVTGFAIAWHRIQVYQHEVWAALLIALSLALYRPRRYLISVCIAVLACLVRELALPFIWVMLAFAIYERRWREATAWVTGMMVFLVLFAIHLYVASGLSRPGDIISSGWFYVGGWNFVVETAKKNELLFFCSNWIVAGAVCLGLIGLGGWRDPWVSRAALIVGGYMIAFLFVGRPDNNYWGYLYSPLLPLGWLLAPVALYDLAARVAPGFTNRVPDLARAGIARLTSFKIR
jgi:hypothetical protein